MGSAGESGWRPVFNPYKKPAQARYQIESPCLGGLRCDFEPGRLSRGRACPASRLKLKWRPTQRRPIPREASAAHAASIAKSEVAISGETMWRSEDAGAFSDPLIVGGDKLFLKLRSLGS